MFTFISVSDWPSEFKYNMLTNIQKNISSMEASVTRKLREYIFSSIHFVMYFFDFVLAMIIAYYYIKDSEIIKNTFLSLVPKRLRPCFTMTGKDINKVLSYFIRGQILTAIILGTIETIILLILKVKYALILGFLGGISNLIPYFGPIIATIPPVAVSLLDSPTKAIWVIVAYIIVQQIDNAFISPKIIEGNLGLHPVITLLAVLVGGEFFGIVGMFLAVPIAAVLKIIFSRTIDAIV